MRADSPTREEMPTLEARLWWATLGTSCCVVAAMTKEDATAIVAARFRDIDRRWNGRVSPCTREQWRRYQGALADAVKWRLLINEQEASRD